MCMRAPTEMYAVIQIYLLDSIRKKKKEIKKDKYGKKKFLRPEDDEERQRITWFYSKPLYFFFFFFSWSELAFGPLSSLSSNLFYQHTLNTKQLSACAST